MATIFGLLLSSRSAFGSLGVGTRCGPFVPGGACNPTNYVDLLSNSSEDECRGACEVQNLPGCCWHSPEKFSCQWVGGGHTKAAGNPAVRSSAQCVAPGPPPVVTPALQQLHSAFGTSETEMLIQWASPLVQGTALAGPVLRYGHSGSAATTWAEVRPQHNASGPGRYMQFRALLTQLTPNSSYSFTVGWLNSSVNTAGRFTVAPREALDWSPRLVMFGDLGFSDNQLLPLLRDEVEAGAVDAIVVFGDMVYWDNGENENSFARDMSLWSGNGSVPVMASPGNGDYGGGHYARYKAQFGMPGWESTDSLYHSFDIGRAHIVGINTESLYGHAVDKVVNERMLAWLETDMRAANTKAARQQRPWLVVHFHRPAYSTGNTDSQPFTLFEPLMNKYGVDVVFAGHVHNQERSFPVRNRSRVDGPNRTNPYQDARAPVYIVSGNPVRIQAASLPLCLPGCLPVCGGFSASNRATCR
jgi:hypothetical protein